MSKKPKKTSATVVLAVVLLFSGIAVIAASFGMQEWQIRQDADEYEALMQSVKAPPQSPMEESSKHLPDENAADATSTDIPMQSEESPAGIPVSTDVPMATASPPPEQSAAPVSDAASRTAASGASGIDLAACKAQNSDFIAWLQIPGTKISYPVVQTDNATYYLTHTFSRKEGVSGCLFSLGKSDYRLPGRNIAIYGHHMRRSRSQTMFQPLHGYKDAYYLAKHPVIHLDSLYHSDTYAVFATLNMRESDWDAAKADFSSDADFLSFVYRAQALSFYDTGIEVGANDQILTLITCDRDYHSENGRLIVMAVRQ